MISTESADDLPEIARKRGLMTLLVIWLIVAVAKTVVALPDLADRTFPDPDDAMRLMQVRDWLGGQSWWDITQYRLNPPFGGPMHWSRYIDLPIAAVELLFRPLVGQYNAETAALVIVPMVTLGVAMLLVYRITESLANRRAALLSAVGTPASIGAMIQMKSMRIDHHGWQIVLALAVVLAALDKNPRRSGISACGSTFRSRRCPSQSRPGRCLRCSGCSTAPPPSGFAFIWFRWQSAHRRCSPQRTFLRRGSRSTAMR
jgi:hypothetical protein